MERLFVGQRTKAQVMGAHKDLCKLDLRNPTHDDTPTPTGICFRWTDERPCRNSLWSPSDRQACLSRKDLELKCRARGINIYGILYSTSMVINCIPIASIKMTSKISFLWYAENIRMTTGQTDSKQFRAIFQTRLMRFCLNSPAAQIAKRI